MMLEFDPLGAFADFIMALLTPFKEFLLGFLPNGDPNVYAVIDSVGSVGGSLTFNVFYFVDFNMVTICLGVLVTVALLIHVIKLIMKALGLAAGAVEAVPIIE